MSDIIKTINNMQIQDTSDPDIQILTIDTTKEEMQNYIPLDEPVGKETILPLLEVIYPTPITGYLLLKEIVPSLDYLYVKTTEDEDTELITYDFSKTYKSKDEDYYPISFPSQTDNPDSPGLGFGIIKPSYITEYTNFEKQMLTKYPNYLDNGGEDMTTEESKKCELIFFKVINFLYDIKKDIPHILTPFNRYKEGFIWDVSTYKNYEETDITNTPEAYINEDNKATLIESDKGILNYNLGYINQKSQIYTEPLLQVVKVENGYISLPAELKGTISFYLAKNLSGYTKLQSLANEYRILNNLYTGTTSAQPV